MYRIQAYQSDRGFVDVEHGAFLDLRRAMAHMRTLVSGPAAPETPPPRCRIVDETGRVHSTAEGACGVASCVEGSGDAGGR